MELYAITEQVLEFERLCAEGAVPEEAEKDTLDLLNMEFDEKADNIACLIKNNAAEVKALKEEAGNLTKRAVSKEKSNNFLLGYLKNNMDAVGKTKVETNRNKIIKRKNPESVEIDAEFIPWAQSGADYFLSFKEPTANKTAIKEALKSGQKVPHARLIQTERIDIK